MGIFSKLFNRTTARAGSGFSASTCVIDANRLAGAKTQEDRVPAREQVQALQRLSRYAKKEEVRVVAILGGKELRAVSHGGDYQGIIVYFSDQAGSLNAAMKQAMRKHANALVVSDDVTLETSAQSVGSHCMRLSTFQKGLDASVGSGGGSEGGKAPRSGGGNRRRSSGNRRKRGSRDGSRNQEKSAKSEESSKPKDPVSELIDLVE